MIEIPKYSIGTYDPNALEDNRRTDFTRRIPTGLSEKQMARDSKIAMQLIRIDQEGGDRAAEKMLDLFFRKAKLLSNPRYWELMRTVWVAAGSTETAQLFRTMMKSARPCRKWFMTPEDSDALDKMQFPVTVYRAYDISYARIDPTSWEQWMQNTHPGDIVDVEDADPGISWTLDYDWCLDYARKKYRIIKQRQVYRNDIFAYVTRRGEEEIIILD